MTANQINRSAIELGIDTGGTYTDAVVVCRRPTGAVEVVSSQKALTTRGDLAVGIGNALRAVLAAAAEVGISPSDVASLSVSTTLATNAVVEGHGDRVAAVLIGFDDQMAARLGFTGPISDTLVVRINGGHDHAGHQRTPLDSGALEQAVATFPPDIEAVAVCSQFAVRNPAHEVAAAAIITAGSALPVTLSTELTGALDATRRSLTAVLNARLVGRISKLVGAVESEAKAAGLSCPVLVVKGDGTRATAQSVRARPIETVMSGPAASALGASALSGLHSCVVSDIGGTTTDIAVLRDGRPAIREDGAAVGGWRTLVRAADVRTSGLGGDSEVHAAIGPVTVGPARLVPLSLLAQRHPDVVQQLELEWNDGLEGGGPQGRFAVLPFGTRTDDLRAELLSESPPDHHEREILAALLIGPRPVRAIAPTARLQRVLERLTRRGAVQISGVTVADAAHLLGMQTTWDAEAAQWGLRLLARLRLMSAATAEQAKTLANEILGALTSASTVAVMESLIESHRSEPTSKRRSVQIVEPPSDAPLIRHLAAGLTHLGALEFQLRSTLPVVAVGGPAHLCYPEVGRRLGAELHIPVNGPVANAVGAALGRIEATAQVTIEPGGAGFRLVSVTGATNSPDLSSALHLADSIARAAAADSARHQGANGVEVKTEESLVYLPGRTDEAGLLTATITATASGYPIVASVS